MDKFIVSGIVLALMLIKKLFFFSIEKQYLASIVGKIELISFIVLFVVGIITFIREAPSYFRRSLYKKTRRKFDPLAFFLLVATIVTIGMSFNLNLNKISMHWDAIALYDARAKFLEDGMKFSEMPALAKYDNLNKYYYLLYPPYTSIGHFFWRNIEFLSQIPVGVYYSVFLTFLVAIVFLVTKESLGVRAGLLLALLVASNNSIFNVSIKEYTNLPFTLHIVAGTLFLFSYIKKRKLWLFFFGTLLVSTSIWIRLLEPIWIAVSLALGITLFSKKGLLKSLVPFLILVFFSILQYVSWIYFTKVIVGNPNFLNFSPLTLIEPIVAVFTGAPIVVITTVARAWGIPLFVYLITLSALAIRWRYVFKNKEILFLGLVLIFSVSIYLFELYFVSFQADWWEAVAKSIDRSSTFLIPISGYLLLHLITNSKILASKS